MHRFNFNQSEILGSITSQMKLLLLESLLKEEHQLDPWYAKNMALIQPLNQFLLICKFWLILF